MGGGGGGGVHGQDHDAQEGEAKVEARSCGRDLQWGCQSHRRLGFRV